MEYKAIDLGLPSGRLWADRNVGAEKETDYGLYFQWGDIVGYADASHSTWATCPGNGGNSDYNEESFEAWYPENLSDALLKPEVDAATVNMGSKWRMPNLEDILDLYAFTINEYAVIDGVPGRKFISKADPSKYIFLPFAGWAAADEYVLDGEETRIWLNVSYPNKLEHAYFLLADECCIVNGYCCRCVANSVRGVC